MNGGTRVIEPVPRELKPALLKLPITIAGCKTLQEALEELNL